MKLESQLNQLITNWENELVEFKQADDSFSTSDIGKYFSALANEANLRSTEKSWLVFGINNKKRIIVGTNYREDKERLNDLKMQISQGTQPSISFRDIHELITPQGRVLLFEIPAAPRGIPIAWHGHYYARTGESLVPLNIDKQEFIRKQVGATDWSAAIIENADITNLDEKAVKKAKEAFAQKYINRFKPDEVMNWPDSTFLNRAKLTIDNKITRATLLLLGKAESSYLLSPHPAQITWKLEGPERAYEHFGPPFLLTTSHLYQRIRNIQLGILPDNELVAREITKYDQKIILEALHNCIAHQDYTRNGRILVTESLDRLVLDNLGAFYEGEPSDYIAGHKTPQRYRNPYLAQAMVELGMIDTMGYGIHEMYVGQARRYLPLPDYDLTNPDAVKITIYGQIVDLAYTRMLIQNSALTLEEITALDRIQKHLPLNGGVLTNLKRKKLIEGRKPNFHVSAFVANLTATKAEYVRTRTLDDSHYKKLIMDYLYKFGSASRKDINDLLWEKLSDALNETQKQNKIGNLLTNLKHENKIVNMGSRRTPKWTPTPP